MKQTNKILSVIFIVLFAVTLNCYEQQIFEYDQEVKEEIESITFRAVEQPKVTINRFSQKIEGNLMGMEEDHVIVQDKRNFIAKPYRIHITKVKNIQIKGKKNPPVLRNMVTGFFIGAGLGGLGGLVRASGEQGFGRCAAQYEAAIGALGLGLVGGLIGSVSGVGGEERMYYDLSEKNREDKINIIKELSNYK